MTESIPLDHPRRESLLLREKIEKGWEEGLVAKVGLVAHGRGEAFDYLLGETSTDIAQKATRKAALLLLMAKRPVISINGNTAVLARDRMLELASILTKKRETPCPLEINIFYRTPQRMKKLLTFMQDKRYPEVKVLGGKEDARIPGLNSERAKCDSDGIFSSDVAFVPLEDGDHCEALMRMGKTVIAVDLNPFSRTARTATLTIVDNIVRVIPLLIAEISALPTDPDSLEKLLFLERITNQDSLAQSAEIIRIRISDFEKHPTIEY